ncbi:MAG TPA: hypothetical protein VFY53_12740 [Rhodoplanes sp.]|nr:hypothetical protein [Rhodoplanes sp.]
MQQMNRRALIVATCLPGATGLYAQGLARDSAEIERDLPIEPPGTGTPRRLDLAAAIRALNIPSVSVALIGSLAAAPRRTRCIRPLRFPSS